MKKIFLIGALLPLFFNAQQQLPLSTYAFGSAAANAYMRDFNNELPPFVGTYRAVFNGNTTTLVIKEKTKALFSYPQGATFYKDALFIGYTVTDASGKVLQSTVNRTLQNADIQFNIVSMSTNPAQKSVSFYYGGTNCSVGHGEVLLKKISDSQLSWTYRPEDIILTPSSCPGNPDTNIYLPQAEALVFTKQ